MMSLTDAIKKWLSVINNAIYYLLIVLSTSSLSFSLHLIFQINYCLGGYPFSEWISVFPQRRCSAVTGLCEAVCTQDWSSRRCFGPQNCGWKRSVSSRISTNPFHRYRYELPQPLLILYSLCFLPVHLQLIPINSILLGGFKFFAVFDHVSFP